MYGTVCLLHLVRKCCEHGSYISSVIKVGISILAARMTY